MLTIQLLLIVLVGYLIGSIPSAYIVTLVVKRINIFEVGSGNMGGTNVARTLGLGWGIFTVFLDAFKGIFAVVASQLILSDSMQFFPLLQQGLVPSATTGIPAEFLLPAMLGGLGAVAGHNWSFFATSLYYYYQKKFELRGGKGAATAFGTMVAILPFIPNVILLVVGISLAVATRYASLSVLVCFSVAFIWVIQWVLLNDAISTLYLYYVIVLSILIVWRFRENIVSLMAGRERKIGERINVEKATS